MAVRPVFVPEPAGGRFVRTLQVQFKWHPGMAKSQAQKSIASLHEAAASHGVTPVLEISSKSAAPLGVRLSAFNLKLQAAGGAMTVETAFQGSKVFERGGPYTDLYRASPRDAKGDPRLKDSGPLVAFEFAGRRWPLQPQTLFYDWLYLSALADNPDLARQLAEYRGFSDIVFNPEKSINCQARSAALYVALAGRGLLAEALSGAEAYTAVITGLGSKEVRLVQPRLFPQA